MNLDQINDVPDIVMEFLEYHSTVRGHSDRTVAGYYLAEVILFSNWKTPLVSVPFNAAQGIGSAVVFIIMGAALDKAGIRSMMNRFLYRN